ncbi:hypothetical protein [Euryhalocaulis caribicus]|uniref:hypothetical protein n=1 Tax=Euryhalocaulis caribicus TaxID=1161401 RepID=UPI0003A13757|nr:hypothetical protein [Euryhalocaulis caribicus]
MSHLYLHIGMNKTGSTSIQRTLQRNAGALADAGFHYYDDASNHTYLIQYLFKEKKHHIRSMKAQGVKDPVEIDRKFEKDIARFEAFLEKHRNGNVILSGEAISRLAASEVQALKAWFSKRFDQIDVIVYLRPPRSAIASMAQQRIKGGQPFSKIFEIFGRVNVLPYREAIEPWLDCFGSKNLHVRTFARDKLVNGDVVEDFFAAIGLSEATRESLRIYRLNESLSLTGVKLLSSMNEEFWRHDHRFGLHPQLFKPLQDIAGPKFGLPDDFMDDQVAKHKEDIDWVRETLGLDLQASDSEVRNVTEESLYSFTPDELVEILRVLGPDWLFDPVGKERAPDKSGTRPPGKD